MSKEIVPSKADQLKSGVDLYNRLSGYKGRAGFDGENGTYPRARNVTHGEHTIDYAVDRCGLSFPKQVERSMAL